MAKFRAPPSTPKEVLLVEDSPGDVRLMQEAFQAANRDVRLHVVSDGIEAMAFLNQADHHAKAPRPDLILLDLNLSKCYLRKPVHLDAIDLLVGSINDFWLNKAKLPPH